MTTPLEQVAWDLDPLVEGKGEQGVHEQLAEASRLADELAKEHGKVAEFDSDRLVSFMSRLGELEELVRKAATFSSLHFSVNMADEERGALMQKVQEEATSI